MQSYIDFEINQGSRHNARELYERLLERTNHVKVWLSFASLEAEALPISEEDAEDEAILLSRQTGEESASHREAKCRRSSSRISPAILHAIGPHNKLDPARLDAPLEEHPWLIMGILPASYWK